MALTEAKITQIENTLNEMKEKNNVVGGLMRIDGVIVKSTIALADVAPMLISRIANVADAMMREAGDKHKEAEITMGSDTLVIVRVEQYLFFGVAKNKDDKKTIVDYSKKIESVL